MQLSPGQNVPLIGDELAVSVTGPVDLTALVLSADGKVAGDADMVFFNQPAAPGVALDGTRLEVSLAALRPGADQVALVASPEEEDVRFGALPPIEIAVRHGGEELGFRPTGLDAETALVLCTVYRRGDAWKLRAVGQGYSTGLAGVATDYGIEIAEEPAVEAGPAGSTAPGSTAPSSTGPGAAGPGATGPGAAEAGSAGPGVVEPRASGAALPGADAAGLGSAGMGATGAAGPGAAGPGAAEAGSAGPGAVERRASGASAPGTGAAEPPAADTATRPAPSAADRPAAAARADLRKRPLGTIDLGKDESAVIPLTPGVADPPLIRASLRWKGRERGRSDLDLFALYISSQGDEGAVWYRRRGRLTGKPWIRLDGDRREAGQETISIVPGRQPYILLCAYSAIGNGIGSFRSYNAHVVVDDGQGSTINLPLYNKNKFSYWVAIALIDATDPDGLRVSQVERYGRSFSERRPLLHPDGTFEMSKGKLPREKRQR